MLGTLTFTYINTGYESYYENGTQKSLNVHFINNS